MTVSCSSFSVATTVFVSLAICAVISYGVFYYFKQRLSVIEESQMEQARIMQAIISRGWAQQGQGHGQGHGQGQGQCKDQLHSLQSDPLLSSHKEITITHNGLIEVSSDDSESESESESESDSESDSQSSDDTESKCSNKWSIGDEIHQPESYHKEFEERFKKNIMLDCIDSISIEHDNENENAVEDPSTKKIISLNKGALGSDDADADADADANASDDASDDDSSSSASDEEVQDKPSVHGLDLDLDLDLKIGYKYKKEPLHLNYANMSVSALRQVAKERGLGGEDGDLQKLKKKELVQLLQ